MLEGSRKRVMLVDDHVLVREALRPMLDREPDFEVVAEAGSGEQALALVDEAAPDLVLMDVRMPGMDGIEATRHLTASRPSLRIVILSAYAEFAGEALRAGALGFVIKKADTSMLLAALRAVASGLTVIDGGPADLYAVGSGRRADRHHSPLSAREALVLRLVAGGLTNRAIARKIGVAPRTADQHLHNIFVKVGARSRAEAIRYAIEHELATDATA